MTNDKIPSKIGQKWLIKGQELHVDTPLIMGILNVTPDSFSDGGEFLDPLKAVARGHEMLRQGATIIDVGGESTRPGSKPVTADEEISRTIPIIKLLASQTNAFISIDTQKAIVARAALAAGAHIINDISGGRNDAEMFALVKENRAGYVLMHMQGTPETMQDDPAYDQILVDVKHYFIERIRSAERSGIEIGQIILDPGIGFGKTLADNLSLLGNMHILGELGRPLLLGASRKSFIGMIDNSSTNDRLGGSLAAVISSYLQGVNIFRVHDVGETRQVLDIFTAIQKHSD